MNLCQSLFLFFVCVVCQVLCFLSCFFFGSATSEQFLSISMFLSRVFPKNSSTVRQKKQKNRKAYIACACVLCVWCVCKRYLSFVFV